jgi:hypothetical protein
LGTADTNNRNADPLYDFTAFFWEFTAPDKVGLGINEMAPGRKDWLGDRGPQGAAEFVLGHYIRSGG